MTDEVGIHHLFWIISFAVVASTFVFMLQAHTVPDQTKTDQITEEHDSSDKGNQPPIEVSMAKEEAHTVPDHKIRNKFMCLKGHLLKRTKADGAFECNVCEAPIAEGMYMRYCMKCDFSECLKCRQ